MMEHMVNFLGYMFFSSLEYFALLLLIFSLFNLYPKYHKKELALSTIIITAISYVLTVTELYNIIPVPLVTICIIAIFLKLILKSKLVYIFVISTIGFVIYALIQTVSVGVSLYFNFIDAGNLADAFTIKTYFIQIVSSSIGIIISIYITMTKSGFGFSFRIGKYRTFSIVTLLLSTLIVVTFLGLMNYQSTFLMLMIFMGVIIVSSLILIFLSYKRDDYEYQ